MKRASVLLAVVLVGSWTLPGGADDGYIAAAALAQAIAAERAPLVIDVRSPEEYARGHVPGAILMPIQAFPGAIERLPADKHREIVVYCEMGPRAGLARAALLYAGYSDVQYLDGHMRAWRQSGLSIEK